MARARLVALGVSRRESCDREGARWIPTEKDLLRVAYNNLSNQLFITIFPFYPFAHLYHTLPTISRPLFSSRKRTRDYALQIILLLINYV